MLYFTEKIQRDTARIELSLTLPWEKRVKSRQRVTLDNGEQAGLMLAQGTVLRGGDVLRTEDGMVAQVKAAVEPLSCVPCDNPLQLARLCYHLGNRHVTLEISPSQVCYPHDHVLDQMVMALGHTVTVTTKIFEPETGAYESAHGHHHD